jgi:hypothetical protein
MVPRRPWHGLPPAIGPPSRTFDSRSGSKGPPPVAPIHAPKGARTGSLPARASPGDPSLGPLHPAGVPSRQPTRHPGRRCRCGGRRGRRARPDPPQARWGRTPGRSVSHAAPRSRLADPRRRADRPAAEVAGRRRPLDGARFAPVTHGRHSREAPRGCSPVPGEASLVREATAGRRCPERSKGGLSTGTIQVPECRGPGGGPAARRGMRSGASETRAGPPRGQRAPVTDRLGTPQFGGQCVGGYRGSPPGLGDCGWCHDGEPGSSPSSYRPTADTVHGNATFGCTRPRRGLVGGRGPWLTPSTPSPACPGCCLTRPELRGPVSGPIRWGRLLRMGCGAAERPGERHSRGAPQ